MEYIGNIIYDDKLIYEPLDIVIFGAGKVGKEIYDYLKMNGRQRQVRCFCDNNSALWGRDHDGVPIVDPKKYIKDHLQSHYLIGTIHYYEEMVSELLENGAGKIHVVYLR